MHEDPEGPNGDPSKGGGAIEDLEASEPLSTVRLAQHHNTQNFTCSKSSRVSNFFHKEAPEWVDSNYCRVFIFEDPDNREQILGYYTLSAAVIQKSDLINRHDRKAPKGIPVPMIRIGFMGRDDRSPQGLGAALIVDAARRIHRNTDIAAWGIVLESEGGNTDNPKLYSWYQGLGFEACKNNPVSLYAPLDRLRAERA